MKKVLFNKAFAYLVRGYSVMPVQKDKKPFLGSWKEYQNRLPTEDEVIKWWEKYKDANIGIITGKISGLSIVDIDNKDIDISRFPETLTVQTGNGGYHLYYQYQEGLSISANAYAQFPGVDIRSDGGFVVAPPSVTSYQKQGKKSGGEYTIIKNVEIAPFPIKLFPSKKPRKGLSALMGVTTGGRNDSIASFAGKLLHSAPEREWESEVWPAVERANKTYAPPLGQAELRTTFDSIMKKEIERRASMILSPIQMTNGEEIIIPIRKNSNGNAYKDMANVLAVLAHHPYYKGTLKYNEFRQEIEYNKHPLEESDLVKIQYFMQTEAQLHGINKEAVYSAISHYANENRYDEAQEWLKALVWDKVPRLADWLRNATGVPNDAYHQGVGAQWFQGMVRRILNPGCIFDYVLVLVGAQGIGKTSLFRIIGGPWYKSYTGAMDNKDFYLALRGAMIVDLDEGAALYRSEAIKIKSIITETHDEYRAPYDRVMKKYPRRFVFSMSTNDTEPFRDVTGNRRYWAVDGTEQINFKWLEENRDQLFAEACHCHMNNIALPDVPFDIAKEQQELHLSEDTWTDLVMSEIKKSAEYCEGSKEYSTTVGEVFENIFGKDKLDRLGKSQEMRITTIFKREAGLDKQRHMLNGNRVVKWVLTKDKQAKLQQQSAEKTTSKFDEF